MLSVALQIEDLALHTVISAHNVISEAKTGLLQT